VVPGRTNAQSCQLHNFGITNITKTTIDGGIATMRSLQSAILVLLGLLVSSSMQFPDFFQQMFNGGQQQQQREQNVPSDSNWYKQNHDAGMFFLG
jgi:hypothetical protein